MIATAVVATLLAAAVVPGFAALLMIAGFALCWIAVAFGLWGQFRTVNRQSRRGFGIAAALTNGALHLASAAVPMIGLTMFFLILFICLILSSVVVGFGAAWFTATNRDRSVSRSSSALRLIVVLVLSAAPLAIPFTQWPLRLAFLGSQPALERLANQVASERRSQNPAGPGIPRRGFNRRSRVR